jgi:hypothetical protein
MQTYKFITVDTMNFPKQMVIFCIAIVKPEVIWIN